MSMHFKDIKLRALEPEDLELLYEWENEDEYWAISNTLSPFSRYTLKLYIENSHKTVYETGQLRLMIDLIPEKKTIGTIDLFDFDSYHQRAGVGILIADKTYRNKGYAGMALQCLIRYCFETLQLHQLFCNIGENNNESLRLFSSAGFTESGMMNDWVKTKDGYLSVKMFQLINNKF